ncbi:BREX-1 system adenine-specific DNA-methyltransferase PglX [Paenibacillus macerans]|uniref:BREX-1 system adenine-specific DNA-methyltransferase PglX n=1 Tax=Paenibacillus macerans TaxID=44252 RepID=UPI002DB896FE|nr:BREX-1 system adenine-specific DNA-methyltransferase PglX [Paenibacillus macerans]MEC0329940.1 BREX-1 system adenine-specific DNA-methyltransferase PglX [Paenibacillus macerans]
MNKTAIKNFAIWARKKLIAEISYKAGLLGITDTEMKSPLPQSTRDVEFYDIGTKEPYSISGIEIEQRKKLAEVIQERMERSDYKSAYNNVIEEVAYTWFNRLIAVRFMEVNDYLPSRVRVLSSDSNGKIEPDLVTSPFDADLEFSQDEKEQIIKLKNNNELDKLFQILFIKQCNALNAVLPELFEQTSDYTELLLNVSFTDQEGVVYHLVHDIPESDFDVKEEGQVEIIGWLYQYYNTELKDETFALLKKNVKITKERIPAATQLFTPDWIVRYMVENSLGRLWLEGHPNDELRAGWKYYLDEAEQEPEVQAQLEAIREQYKTIKPEDIKVIDPCMGSGHILVYAFDVLMQIYESYGYSQRDAARSILEHNLYGLDIDKRAYHLAYFAVMMKARQYNRRILNGETKCHLYAIQESNGINREQLKYFGVGMDESDRNMALHQMEYLLDTMHDAKEFGSILIIDELKWGLLEEFVERAYLDGQVTADTVDLDITQLKLKQLVQIAAAMAQKYDVVVTNPPYMGSSGMGPRLAEYLKRNYPASKSDLSTACMEMSIAMNKSSGYSAMINIPVWMFLSTYEGLREKIISISTIYNMLHLGRGVFGSDFGTTAFIIKKSKISKFKAIYRRLFLKQGSVDSVLEKEKMFFDGVGHYEADQALFNKIPGIPIAYWLTPAMFRCFDSGFSVRQIGQSVEGIKTGDNDKYLRLWFEVSLINSVLFPNDDPLSKWHKITKGGAFRKWYGNLEYLVAWGANGEILKKSSGASISNSELFYSDAITWTYVTSGAFSMRCVGNDILYNNKGPGCYLPSELLYYILGLMNTKVAQEIILILAPTIDCKPGNIANFPVIFNESHKPHVENIVASNIEISKMDWNFFETSWDFSKHPLLFFKTSKQISTAYMSWEDFTRSQFVKLKNNEEELNRIFIEIYGLQDELTPEVDDKDITIRKADLGRDVRSFLSYAVGCMFGRYSLDVDGLAYAGGEWDSSKYKTFIPDKDNVIPITDEEYFEDDIVGLFCAFLKKTFGEETLEENLDFIAKALGNKGNTSREVIRNYFLKDFYKDHCKIYQKRPIYWLFDSGKADGFKALVYMHRYNADTIGNLRIDYLHRMQRVYDSEIARMQETIDNSGNAREVAAATKRKEKLTKQLKETKEYDEKIAHLALARIEIDLDDGVKVNYEKVQTAGDGKKYEILAKI